MICNFLLTRRSIYSVSTETSCRSFYGLAKSGLVRGPLQSDTRILLRLSWLFVSLQSLPRESPLSFSRISLRTRTQNILSSAFPFLFYRHRLSINSFAPPTAPCSSFPLALLCYLPSLPSTL